MLQGQPDLEIMASLENSAEAVLKARELKPHVVLINVNLGDQNSLNLAAALSEQVPGTKLVAMGLAPTQEKVLDFVQVGASGFILEDATLSGFLSTIRFVAEGRKVLPPPLTGSLFSQIVDRVEGISKLRTGDSVRMTRREREVIELIGAGLSNKEIAQRLHLAVYTVKSHVHNILEKLALRSRLEIASYVHAKGTAKSNNSF